MVRHDNYDLTTATHGYHVTPDQRRARMGAGTLPRNGDPDYIHGLNVGDRYATITHATTSASDVRRTPVMAETMTMATIVTSRDHTYLRQCTVTATVTTRDNNVTTDRRTTNTHPTDSTGAHDCI